MSGPGDSLYSDSPGETPATADNDHQVTQARSSGTEHADVPLVEPLSREEYADHMRQGPAADLSDEVTNGNDTGDDGQPGDGDNSRSAPAEQAQGMDRSEYADHMRQGPAAEADEHDTGDDDSRRVSDQPGDTRHEQRWDDPAEQAQGMTRSEYADHMRQEPAVGDNDPGFIYDADSDDPSGEPYTSSSASDADTSRSQEPDRAATGLVPAERPTASSTHSDLDNSDGARPEDNGDASTDKAEVPAPAHDDRPQQPPRDQDAHEKATPSHRPADSWPPPGGDQDRVRKLYSEYLADTAAADSKGGRGQGTNVVGSDPDRSPGDISDLPPSGDRLVEMEPSKKSRFGDLLREAEKEENLNDLHGAIEKNTSTIQKWLSARPPEGHAEQPVPTSSSYIAPWVPEHGIEGGNAATAVMVAGILTIHLGRWINGKLKHRKDDHDVSNR